MPSHDLRARLLQDFGGLPIRPRRSQPATLTLIFAVTLLGLLAGTGWPIGTAHGGSGVALVAVQAGFTKPLFVTNAGDARLFVVEQGGAIKVIDKGQVSTFVNLSAAITSVGSEQGLLGLAFDPAYATNRRFYVMYTATNGDNTISSLLRSVNDPNQADPNSLSEMVRIPDFASNHNGGMLAFRGPYLYAGTGDGGGIGDPNGNGQKLDTKLGKILRLDVNNPPTWVPADNPFVNTLDADPLIWDFGLRNPWRFGFDRANGDLYIADVGQGAWEEVDFEPAASGGGRNYGWDVLEGRHCFARSLCQRRGKVPPVYEYGHTNGRCSITGGYVYRGSDVPALAGKYVFADYCSGEIWTLQRSRLRSIAAPLLDTPYNVSSFGEDRDGEVYLVDHAGGVVYRFAAQ